MLGGAGQDARRLPLGAEECSIRAQEYRPEFPAESSAVMITKFMTSAPKGRPTVSNTATKGLSSVPAVS